MSSRGATVPPSASALGAAPGSRPASPAVASSCRPSEVRAPSCGGSPDGRTTVPGGSCGRDGSPPAAWMRRFRCAGVVVVLGNPASPAGTWGRRGLWAARHGSAPRLQAALSLHLRLHAPADRPHGRSPPRAPVTTPTAALVCFLVCRHPESLAGQHTAGSAPGVRRRGGRPARRLVCGRRRGRGQPRPPSHGAQGTGGWRPRPADTPFWCVFGVPPCQIGADSGRLRATIGGGTKKAPALSL